MARIIIDKGALERGEPAIQIVTDEGGRLNFREVRILGSDLYTAATVEQLDEPGQDGTRIQITVRHGAHGS
jgi:hypothetical protein